MPVVGKPKRGRGRPPGPTKNTLDKIAAREYLRRKVIEHLDPILDAQIASARGIRHCFMRDQGGKFVMLEDPKLIEAALNSGEEGKYYWLFTKDPSTQASKDLLDRALDKPADHVELTGKDNGPIVVKWDDGTT